MAEVTDAVLAHLKNKTPQQIEKTLKNLSLMAEAEAQESGQILAKQQARDAEMSLNDVQAKLETAINKGDLQGVERWQELHKEKLQWTLTQVNSAEAVRVDKINAPLVQQRQQRRNELLTELDALSQNNVSQNLDRIEQLSKELRGLA